MPTGEKVTRKLRAILSADVKGYSLLMADDEAYTIKTLKEYRSIMSRLIQEHNGRVVDTPGDNLLADFSSVVDAVECAVQIQQRLKAKNERLEEDKRLQFRIGVNIGDVVQDGDRIYGNGVNVAARIEGLAESGGICISRNAYSHVRDKLELGYEYFGEHSVKNIKRPVRVYKVLMDPEDAGKLIEEKSKPSTKKWVWPMAAAIVVLLGIVAWQVYEKLTTPEFEPASLEKMAFPIPEKPSIAVLPFDNMSGDSEQEYFSDGLSEEIITALSKSSQIFVIARNSSFTYKGKPVKIQQVAEDLGVRYVLEGSVRKDGDRVRITAQLIDAVRGIHLWAERYDRELIDIFAIQDDITKQIITALHVKLSIGEDAQLIARTTNSLDAYLKYLVAREDHYKFIKEDNLNARRLLEEIIAIDPEYGSAYALLGATHMQDVWLQATDSPKKSLGKAIELQQKAITLGVNAHHALGFLYLTVGKHDQAFTECKQAVELNPNSATARTFYGIVLGRVGRFEEAVHELEQGLRFDPFASSFTLRSLALAYSNSGRPEDAIVMCKKSTQKAPNDLIARIICIQAYSSAGRQDEAENQAAEVLRINPKFTLKSYEKRAAYKNKADTDRMITILRNAGLPYEPPLPLPDKPSIAVLAFDNLSGDPEQGYFSDGIAVEIINALVRWPSIVIIPRSSSFIYKGKTVDVKQVGREMGVRYVLEGSVRREENRVRVTVQLVDVTTLKHLFSERYDREMKDIFAIQDEITMGVLTAMRVSLSGTGLPSQRSKPTKSIDAYLKLLQAEDIFLSMNRDAQARAKRLAEEAIALDPEYARAYALMSGIIGNEVLLGVYENPQEAFERAIELNERAIQLDDSESMAHRVRGFLALQKKDYKKAIAEARRAIELAPNSVMAQMILGYFLYSAGRTEEAIPILENAVALSPIPSPRALSHLGIAYRKARRYEEAVEVCRKLIQIKPNYIYPHLTLAATFAEMDKMEEAQAEIEEVLRINPKYTVKLVPRSFPWKDQTELDRLADSLRKAGLPD